MTPLRIALSVLFLSTLSLAALSQTHPNEPLYFHGQLRNAEGIASGGVQRVTLRMYDNKELSGLPLWAATTSVFADKDGYYSVDFASAAIEDARQQHKTLYVEAEAIDEGERSSQRTVTPVTTVPQGIWMNCNPDNGANNCDIPSTTMNAESAIKTIAAGHFRYILNADNFWGTQGDLQAYANQAKVSGVKIIWYLGSDFSQQLSSSSYSLVSNDTEISPSFCGGCSNTAFVTSLIKFLKAFPSTAGYLIDDEQIQSATNEYPITSSGSKAATTNGKEIAALARVIRAADASHAIYGTEDYAMVPDASESELSHYFSYIPSGTLNSMGLDYYPVGSLNNTPTDAQLINDQKTNGNWLGAVAKSSGVSNTFEDLQANNWSDSWEGGCPTTSCSFPSVAQLRDMLEGATSTTTAPAEIFWWEYTDVLYNKQWNNLLTAANPQ